MSLNSKDLSFLKEFVRSRRRQCLETLRTITLPSDGETFCNGTIDQFGGCWHPTLAGKNATAPCPLNDNVEVSRRCLPNGTWDSDDPDRFRYVNYSSCTQKHFAEHTHVYIFIAGYSLSIVLLILSLAVFYSFRQLRCGRVSVHRNLFLSYIFTGITWIMYNGFVVLKAEVVIEDPVWCRVLHVLAQYFTVCNFAWMFCEGLYLHTILLKALSSAKLLLLSCYVTGWGIPILLTGIYAGLRGHLERDTSKKTSMMRLNTVQVTGCWLNESSYQWIIYGPIVFSLVINFLFLINIVRLLMTKLQQIPESTQKRFASNASIVKCTLQMLQNLVCCYGVVGLHNLEIVFITKAARATLVLIPLLGLQYLLIPMRPPKGSDLEEFYSYFSAVVVSLQGSFVAIMYCLCNGEVLSIIKRKWEQHRLMSGAAVNRNAHSYTVTESTHLHANGKNGKRNGVEDNRNGVELVPLKEEMDN